MLRSFGTDCARRARHSLAAIASLGALALLSPAAALAAGASASDASAATGAPSHPTARFVQSRDELPTTKLAVHRPLAARLVGADVHRYALHMRAGEFAAVRVAQHDGNLVIVAFDPAGRLLAIVDENGAGHAEVATLVAARSGRYTLQLAMYEWDAPPVHYRLEWHVRERAQRTPRGRAAQLLAAWYEPDRPGAVVAVLRGGTPILVRARGLADAERAEPLDAHTRIDVGSMAKQFTGYAIALLATRGRLALDDDVRRWLPELPEFGATITLRELLEHRSGLRDWDGVFGLAGKRIEDGISADDVLAMSIRQRATVFEPGSAQEYSNTGYVLLALVIERATGEPFDDWMTRNVFAPLGMRECGFSRARVPLGAGEARSYAASYPVPVARTRERLNTIGSSGLECSVHDLRRWLANYARDTLGGPAVRSLVNGDGIRPDATPVYAFGRWLGRRDGQPWVGHQGLAAGFRASMHEFPASDLALIYLANDGNDATYVRVAMLENLFLGVPERPVEVPGDDYVPAQPAPADPSLPGAYQSPEAALCVEVVDAGHGPQLRHPVLGDIPLVPRGTDAYATPSEFWPLVDVERAGDARADALLVKSPDLGALRFARVAGCR